MRHERLLKIRFVQGAHGRESGRNRASASPASRASNGATGWGHQVGEAILARRLGDVLTERSGVATGRRTPDTGGDPFLCLDLTGPVNAKERKSVSIQTARDLVSPQLKLLTVSGINGFPTRGTGIQPPGARHRSNREVQKAFWMSQIQPGHSGSCAPSRSPTWAGWSGCN